jgi:LysM repeat protein
MISAQNPLPQLNGNKIRNGLILLFVLVLSSLFAQEPADGIRSDLIEEYQGQQFYIHQVKPGQTLYSICRVYEVATEEVLAHNPEARNGLRPDQVLKIPAKPSGKTVVNSPVADTVKTGGIPVLKDSLVYYIRHEVGKGETLYGLARQYNITIDDLYLLNPGLKTEGLKKGEIIKIPVSGPDAFPEVHSGTLAMTAYVFPHTKDTLPQSPGPAKPCDKLQYRGEVYRIALLLPLYLNDVYQIEDGDTVAPPSPDTFKSFSFIQFYEGALIALDSLARKGMNIKAYVYDVSEDPSKARALVLEPEFRKMDLIIGPVFKSSFDIISGFALEQRIPVINPFTKRSDVVAGNPYVFKIQPALFSELNQLVHFLASSFPGANFMIVYQNSTADQETGTFLRDKLSYFFEEDLSISNKDLYSSIQSIIENDTSQENVIPDSLYTDNLLINSKMIYSNPFDSLKINNQVREVYYYEEGMPGLLKKASFVRPNVIICLSTDRVFVADLMSHIQAMTSRYVVTLVGMPEWNNADLDLEYAMKLNLHFFSPEFVDYRDERVKRFVIEFRNRFRNDPVIEKYAFEGFDLVYYFMNALKDYGKDFPACLQNIHYSGLQSGYLFRKHTEGGFENEYVSIIKFQDYKMIRVK